MTKGNIHEHGVHQLAAGLNMSPRRLQQRFSEAIGYGPKTLYRLLRFQKALRKLSSCNNGQLTKLALDCDYFDQSHFIREFKSFSGLNPTQYLAEQHPLNDLMQSPV